MGSNDTFSKALDKIRNDLLKQGFYYILPEEPDDTEPNFSHINNGYCGAFSGAVCELYGDQVVEMCEEDIGISKDEVEHWFVKYEDRYYDAECIEGVEDPKNLPIFKSLEEA